MDETQEFTLEDNTFVALLPRIVEASYFEGYFQFQEVAVHLKPCLEKKYQRILASSRTQAIAVHIRRGDYLQPKNINYHGLCSISYYIEAVRLLRNQIGDLDVHVFTDSEAEVSKEIPISWRIFPQSPDPEIDLLKMSMYRALVISNSTFSWWSAYIGSQCGDRGLSVVSPEPWFASPSTADKNLFLEQWIRLDKDPY